MAEKVCILWSDITCLTVDAVVNAANCHLSGGEGVDGAIHWAAGSGLDEECAALGWCETGDAVITGGYNLPARYIIHTVGPVWRGGDQGEPEQLAGCYRRCFELAHQHGIRTIAFPAIASGIYGFPLDRGSDIAMVEARIALEKNPELEQVYFVVYSAGARKIYLQALDRIFGA
ncbi:MAG: macro domain-containing protein [Desulfuromonadales bacterium]|nr:macro domain-containing protein [Desulfuromonadales bacterium]